MAHKPKPKRTYSRKQQEDERVARALLDAELFGDKRAAEKHGVHFKTIANWRGDAPSEGVRAAMDRLRAKVSETWIDEGRALRRKLIDRIAVLSEGEDDLTAVTDALRRVHEVVMSHEIVNDPDAEPDDADQQEDQDEAQEA